MKKLLLVVVLLSLVACSQEAKEINQITTKGDIYLWQFDDVDGKINLFDCEDLPGVCKDECSSGERVAGSMMLEGNEAEPFCGSVTIKQRNDLMQKGLMEQKHIKYFVDSRKCCVSNDMVK